MQAPEQPDSPPVKPRALPADAPTPGAPVITLHATPATLPLPDATACTPAVAGDEEQTGCSGSAPAVAEEDQLALALGDMPGESSVDAVSHPQQVGWDSEGGCLG